MNLLLYGETSCFALLFIGATHPSRFGSFKHFFHGFSGDCYLIAIVSIMLGLSVSRILRYASAITKNFVMALHCPVEVVCAHFYNGTVLTGFSFVSALLIGIATCTYYLAPAQKPPSEPIRELPK